MTTHCSGKVRARQRQKSSREYSLDSRLTKTLLVVAWIARFTGNSCLKREERMAGPLRTDEIQRQHLFWTKHAERGLNDKVTKDKQRLRLEENVKGIFEC